MTELCDHCDKHTTKLYDSGGKDKICESCFDHYSREKDKDESQEDYETRLPLRYDVLQDLKETAQGSEVRYEVLIRCCLQLIKSGVSVGLKSDPEEEDDGFEDCECGYSHHYEDKCPTGNQIQHYEKVSSQRSS